MRPAPKIEAATNAEVMGVVLGVVLDRSADTKSEQCVDIMIPGDV